MKPTFFGIPWTDAAFAACVWLAFANGVRAADPLIVCSPDKTHFATVAEQGQIRYRDASDKTNQHTFYICHPKAICFSLDGTLLAAAGGRNGSPGKIKVWRISDGKELCVMVAAGQGVKVLALSADATLLAGVGSDGRVEVWRIPD